MQEAVDRAAIQRRLTELAAFWQDRIATWRAEGTESGTEKRHAQQFWSDLMRCFGITPERIDVFERNADRASTGGGGFIDFFWSGVVIGEAKSLGHDLDVAYNQALDYLNGGSVSTHEWPRFIMATDFEHFRLDRLGEDSWTLRFTLGELPDYLDQLLFFAGVETLTKREQETASIEAARIMARLFNTLAGEDADEDVGDDAPTNAEADETELASILMTRLLFLMYGDDAGLWEEDLFYRWLESVNSKNLGPSLDGLFQILNTDPQTRHARYRGNLPDLEARFPYVNGGIFDGTGQLGYSVPAEFKDVLLDAARFRWTTISPAIFGSMFQLVKKKEARRGDGEHYTSETNILKTIEPLFLDEYRRRADRLIANKSTSVPELRRLQQEIASNIYVDPACGAGNFLNVAYAKLREIETGLIVERRKREGTTTGTLDSTLDQLLTIDKFYGFELNWWPAKIAETAMFLVDHQANRELAARTGEAPDRLPIEITATIIHGNALELDWEATLPETGGRTFVFGNPPFIGQYTKTSDQTADMKRVWGKDYDGYLDYVTGWHAKAKDLLADRYGEFAYVTTNSITQGQPVPALFGPLYREGWRIKFAHRTFAWDSEAPGQAAVHCVIVGLTRDRQARRRLWDYPDVKGEPIEQKVTTSINAYLIDGPEVLVRKRMTPLASAMSQVTRGSQPTDGGNLIVEVAEYEEVSNDPIAAKYLRPFRMGRELVQGLDRWCLWMAGPDFTPQDLNRSKVLRERVTAVREMRLSSNKKATNDSAATPHLFQENHQPGTNYVGIPAVVSETRRYYTAAHLGPDVIAGNKVYTADDPDGLLFGVISSSMFITWQQAVGGRLKSDLNFSNTLVWNTLPLPELDTGSRQRIIDAGERVLQARSLYPDRSLADAYNPLAMDPALVKAHETLDRAVDRAFGASRRLTSDKQRLELLFPAYQQLTKIN